MSEATDIQTPKNEEPVRCTGMVRRDGDIGTHLARALADGRYDENKAWKYGRTQKRRPTDPIPDGAVFGGQYSMKAPNVLITDDDEQSAPTKRKD